MRWWKHGLALALTGALLAGCGSEAAPTATAPIAPATTEAGPTPADTAATTPTAAPEAAISLSNADGVAAWLAANPGRGALVVSTVDEAGALIADEQQIVYGADRPMPLASMIKIITLAAYAYDVEAGTLDPSEEVPLAAWEEFYLPGTDGGAHGQALTQLGFQVDEAGAAAEPGVATLEQLADAMIFHSDNAASDYLRDRVSPEAFEAVMAALEPGQDLPLSFTGLFLLYQNHEATTPVSELAALEQADLEAVVAELEERYRDSPWGDAERAWRRSTPPSPVYANEAAFAALTPRGTAGGYAALLGQVAAGTFLSAEVSERMRSHLDWPMDLAGNESQFETLGAKGGALAGVLTDGLYLVPAQGDFAGQTRVVVIAFSDLSVDEWTELLGSFAHQQLAAGVATEPEQTQALKELLAQ